MLELMFMMVGWSAVVINIALLIAHYRVRQSAQRILAAIQKSNRDFDKSLTLLKYGNVDEACAIAKRMREDAE